MTEEGTDGFEIDENESVEEAMEAALNEAKGPVTAEVQELNNRYLRLYADFDNYRKRVNKDKEELIRYGNETLLYEMLPVIDSLELALKHSSGDENSAGLVKGVEMTLKEMQRTLEKFGLTRIEAADKPFDPAVHHAMAQVEREDIPEMMVAEELRAGYLYRDKVLRPSLVMVSVRPKKGGPETAPQAAPGDTATDDDSEIKIKRIIEEE